MATDYKALLMAYMAHVIDAESISFIEIGEGYGSPLTEDQRRELLEIEREVRAMMDKQA